MEANSRQTSRRNSRSNRRDFLKLPLAAGVSGALLYAGYSRNTDSSAADPSKQRPADGRVIDEHHPAALALRDIIGTAVLYREYAEVQRRRESGFSWLSLEAQRSTIPPITRWSGPGDRSTSGIM